MRLLLASLAAIGWMAAAGAEVSAPEGRVLLTVGGDLPDANAPGGTADDTTFAGYLDLEYDKAVAFDDAMLGQLPQHEVKAMLLDTGKEIAYSGPRLSDVLKASGAEGRTALPMALDGYQAEIPWDQIEKYQPILATHGDGVPLPLGKLGPAMIVFPVVADKELYESFGALEVFATFFIAVE